MNFVLMVFRYCQLIQWVVLIQICPDAQFERYPHLERITQNILIVYCCLCSIHHHTLYVLFSHRGQAINIHTNSSYNMSSHTYRNNIPIKWVSYQGFSNQQILLCQAQHVGQHFTINPVEPLRQDINVDLPQCTCLDPSDLERLQIALQHIITYPTVLTSIILSVSVKVRPAWFSSLSQLHNSYRVLLIRWC